MPSKRKAPKSGASVEILRLHKPRVRVGAFCLPRQQAGPQEIILVNCRDYAKRFIPGSQFFFSAINTAAGTRFMDGYLRELRQAFLEPYPDPAG